MKKYKEVDKHKIKRLPKVEDYTILHEGDGELIGVCSKPGIKLPDPDAIIRIYCRDLVHIMDINTKELVTACEAILDERKASGIHFKESHYSNMVEMGFKFKQRLLMSGDIDDLTFYFKV